MTGQIVAFVPGLILLIVAFVLGLILLWVAFTTLVLLGSAIEQRLDRRAWRRSLPSAAQIYYILDLAQKQGVEAGDMPKSAEAASAMIDALEAGDMDALAGIPRVSHAEVKRREKVPRFPWC